MQLPKLRFIGVRTPFRRLRNSQAVLQYYRSDTNFGGTDRAPRKIRSKFCLPETQGAESYPSQDKAVLFFEVADLAALLDAIGKDKNVHCGRTVLARPAWALIHDPQDYLQARKT